MPFLHCQSPSIVVKKIIMPNPDLPQDIIFEIFLKLPTKSVGKCRCLSKPWRSRLSTSRFINLHLSCKPNPENLILVTLSRSLNTVISPTKYNEASKEIQLPNAWAYVFGSCNGLLLLANRETDKMFVANPTTLQQVHVPDSTLDLKNDCVSHMYGFGHDRFCDDYKVVKLSYHCCEKKHEQYSIVDVYYVKRRLWKRVGHSPFGYTLNPANILMPFVNGAVHWLTSVESGTVDVRIGAFDLENESFHEIPFPKQFEPKILYNGLVILGGCLSIVDCLSNGRTDLWIMKEYGVVDSWVRYRIDVNGRWNIIRPVCFVDDEQLLSFTERDCWVLYDLKDQTTKDISGGISSTFSHWGTFAETLVSPELCPSFELTE